LKADFGLFDASEAKVAAEDGQGSKKRGRVFAAADGDADGLKGLPGLQTKVLGGSAKRLVERIVIEGRRGQNFLSILQDT
jgi:hypothetical protein